MPDDRVWHGLCSRQQYGAPHFPPPYAIVHSRPSLSLFSSRFGKETHHVHFGFARTGQRPHRAKTALALAVLSLFGLASTSPAAAQTTTVYSNNFTNGAGPGWSTTTTDTTPGTAAHTADKFLGQFANQTTTLTLNGLTTHSTVNVTFDLYVLRSMDGNGNDGNGPDPRGLNENGHSLINTNFANISPQTQDFGGSNGMGGYLTGGSYALKTGAAESNTLGYNYLGVPMDSVYHFSFTFNDAATALALNFIGGQTQDITDESWGLDNVVVKTNAAPVPEASTTVSFGLLLTLGLGGLIVARRRKASASTE